MIPTLVSSASFLIVMLDSTKGAASVQKALTTLDADRGDRGWVTPDWEVFGCALYPLEVVGGDAVEGCGQLGVRWRGMGDRGCDGGV